MRGQKQQHIEPAYLCAADAARWCGMSRATFDRFYRCRLRSFRPHPGAHPLYSTAEIRALIEGACDYDPNR